MIPFANIVKFNAQTSGRDKLIRLCQYTTKFIGSILSIYHRQYAKGGSELLELIYRLREFEQYFVSCRRVLSFGCFADQFYSAFRSMQLYDPVLRTTLSVSKLWLSFQMFSDHILWLNQMGIVKVEKQRWVERGNKFWLYSTTVNLLRDFYELICVIQQKRNREKDNLDSELVKFTPSTPIRWARNNPKLSCDLIKNCCDFWIPYSFVNKIELHPSIIALLGMISSTMSILQIYDKENRLSPM